MLFFVILIIALGWAGWFWAWGRDRYVSKSGLGLPPSPFGPQPQSPLGAPRTSVRARRRRREVLAALATGVLLSFLIARNWSPMWLVTIGLLGALVAYGRAVYLFENPEARDGIETPFRARLGPVMDDQRVMSRPGPIAPPE